jgi:hypothetical protein
MATVLRLLCVTTAWAYGRRNEHVSCQGRGVRPSEERAWHRSGRLGCWESGLTGGLSPCEAGDRPIESGDDEDALRGGHAVPDRR